MPEDKKITGLVFKELKYTQDGEEKIPMINFEIVKRFKIKKTLFSKEIEVELA